MEWAPIRTLDYLFNRVKTRFGKSTPELEAQFILDVTDELRVISAEYPYWFLKVEPGGEVPAGFLSGTLPSPDQDGWMDSGWFQTSPDVQDYTARDRGSNKWDPGWFPVEFSQINYAKVYDLDGHPLRDLKVVNGDLFHSFVDFSNRGTPNRIFPVTDGYSTKLRLHPIPDQEYMVAISAQFAYPPWYRHGNTYTNSLLAYYPRAMYHLGMMYFAEYFQEMALYQFHKEVLYGKVKGSTRSDNPDYGLIGAMKMDSERRELQQTPDISYGESVKDLVGRDHRAHLRRPGGVYYSDTY
jgi:hypothetical protein